ncbi:MAG TPA: hypothetical protein VIP57_12205 [Candidatus Dormibacteraeota bacterium]|jgi:hypothetical protein
MKTDSEVAVFRTPGLPLVQIILLAALTLPRVVVHDLRLIAIDAPAYTALAVIPLLVWLLVAIFRKSQRPLLDFVVLGLAYGLLLGLTHQVLWDASWGDDIPHIGGNLAGTFSPFAENLILRAFAVASSMVTGLAFGLAFGLLAVLAAKLRERQLLR